MLTPSLVIVGAPHFFSSTTLRPLGPRVTLTASASVFMPRSRPRRASSLKAISFGITLAIPHADESDGRFVARDGRSGLTRQTLPAGAFGPRLLGPGVVLLSLSQGECQPQLLALGTRECKQTPSPARTLSLSMGSDGEQAYDEVGEGGPVHGELLEVQARLGDLELADRQLPVRQPHLVHPGVVQARAEDAFSGLDRVPGQASGL